MSSWLVLIYHNPPCFNCSLSFIALKPSRRSAPVYTNGLSLDSVILICCCRIRPTVERAFATLAGSEPDVTLSVRDMEKLWTECAFAIMRVDGREHCVTGLVAQDCTDWIVPEEVSWFKCGIRHSVLQ